MYQPNRTILKKYADVLIKFALWSGKGIKKGDTVCLQVPESAKPILVPLQEAVLEAGGHPVIHYLPDGHDRWENASRSFYENATLEQATFMPKNYLLGRVEDCDHFVAIIAEANPQALKGVDTKKVMARKQAAKFYKDARFAKENAGKLTWTLALYGTEGMAKEAGLTLRQYWNQIIKACYLNDDDPIKTWKNSLKEVERLKSKLTKMKIQKVHITGEDVDLHIKIGEKRQWLGGSGRNIPSFEVFISPDWRGTEGTIKFNQPLYRYGNLIEGINLTFKRGKVVKATASKNEKLLHDMLKIEGADKVGEFSLTDKRLSRITKFMANTLFDENVGGKYGNTHIALGSAYDDSYTGDVSKVKKAQLKALGFNDSAEHTDIMSTTNRTVTATLPNGTEKIIYQDGNFTV